MKPMIRTLKRETAGMFVAVFILTGSPPLTAGTKPSATENSVVKVFSSARYPDLSKPWTKQAPTEVIGSGVVIEGKRILCNAHVVLYASHVRVQAHQAGDKFSAHVEVLATGIDLAVLKLDDEQFFDAHPPLPRAKKLPEIRDMVMAYGYPDGGTSLSITKGIVSRIEFAPYTHSVWGLLIQVDAAINPGNSGGPAMVDDQMIGLTLSRMIGADNIGYIIPSEEIELFLEDVADGQYHGKAAMFDELQSLENPALRAFLGLDSSAEGLVVHRPESKELDYPLRKWDLITRIGDTAVDNQGSIRLEDTNLRVNFRYVIQRIAEKGRVPLTVVRDGQELRIELPVPSTRPLVIPSLEGAYPSYFIYGPLVFSSATIELVDQLPSSEAGARLMGSLIGTGSPLMRRFADKRAFDGEGLVFVSSPFFPSKLANGYDNPDLRVVKNVGDVAVRNLGHLVEVLRDYRDEFITIEFDMRGSESLVFRHNEMLAATEEILTDNGVRSRGSPDTLGVWNANPCEAASEQQASERNRTP